MLITQYMFCLRYIHAAQVKSEDCFGLTQCSPDWASYRFHQSTFEQLKQSVEKAKAALQDRTSFLGSSAFRYIRLLPTTSQLDVYQPSIFGLIHVATSTPPLVSPNRSTASPRWLTIPVRLVPATSPSRPAAVWWALTPPVVGQPTVAVRL